MDKSAGYIAVDWGTTNRRGYRLDAAHNLQSHFEDHRGITTMSDGDFSGEVQEIRLRLGDLPVLLAGTVGSSRGWHQTGYIELPAGPTALAAGLLWLDPGRTAIIPGVSQRDPRADVMRSEELQAIGAALIGLAPDPGLSCHPGTHAKWIRLSGGMIRSFRTTMTGELFALLRSHTILAEHLRGEVTDGPAFRFGVQAALAGAEPLTELFGYRARALLDAQREHAASHASGLLIGADIRAGLSDGAESRVTVVGRTDLGLLYAAGLEEAGITATLVDGAEAFLAGVKALVDLL